MKKLNKILLWIVAMLLSIFILVNIALTVFAKQIVVKQIEQNLKLRSTLASINLSLPFSINLNNLTVGDLFQASRVSISPNILGFFAGKIVLNGLTLVNPVINLEESGDGSLNLPRLGQKVKQPPLYLMGLKIINGRVNFSDKKIDPAGYKVILAGINAHISKVILPLTSLKANFEASLDVLEPGNKILGSILFSGWLDFGPKDMDGVLTIKDLDLTYFSPYYGNFISKKKLLQAVLNLDTTFKSKNNNLAILTDLKLSNLVYAQEKQVEGQPLEIDFTKNALDFFTDSKGNLNLEFNINTKLDNPGLSAEQCKKIILKAATKNISHQSPEELMKKVNNNLEQFKAIGKSLESIFKKKK